MLTEYEKDCEITKDTSIDAGKPKDDDFGSQRVYKKTSPNSVLTLYLGSRDVVCRQGVIEPLRGVIYIDPKFVPSHKIYGQLTLTFRYGREDEEVMGLKFCNEAIIALKQIWPKPNEKEELSSLQEALLARLGKNSYPFSLEIGTMSPPSVQLIPAKRYNGAPIGTSYDIRVHMADQIEERLHRRCMVRLGVRVIHKISSESKSMNQLPISSTTPILPKTLRLRLSPKALKLAHKFSSTNTVSSADKDRCQENGGGAMSRIDIERGSCLWNDNSKGPEGSVDKPFLWTDGRVSLRAALNKSAYSHGEHISVTVDVRNDSRKIIRKIRIFAVQHVDVCMFSNGKFKNVVADINESNQIKPGERHRKVYSLLPIRGPTKNWIAVEGNPSYNTTLDNFNYKIAASAPRGQITTVDDRNVFAIYVSYYIKVKLALSGMGGEVSLKLPFILGHVEDVTDDQKLSTNIVNPAENQNLGGDIDATTIVNSKIIDENLEAANSTDIQTYTDNCNDVNSNTNTHFGTVKIPTVSITTTKSSVEDDDASSPECSRPNIKTTCDVNIEIERNVNVITAQIHNSAIQ